MSTTTYAFLKDEKNRICFGKKIITFIKKFFGQELEIRTWRDHSSELGYKIILSPKPDSTPLLLVRPDRQNRITIPNEIMSIPSLSAVKKESRRVICRINTDSKLIIIRL